MLPARTIIFKPAAHVANVNVEGSNPFARSIFIYNDLQKSFPELPQKVTTNTAVFDCIGDV